MTKEYGVGVNLSAICIVLMLLAACVGEQKAGKERADKSGEADSIGLDTTAYLQDLQDEPSVTEEEEDELFEDFFGSYVNDRAFWRERTPLDVPMNDYISDSLASVGFNSAEPLLVATDYYAALYERDEDLDVDKEPLPDTVIVEQVDYLKGRVEAYHFALCKRRWELCLAECRPLKSDRNGEFLEFFGHFIGDSLYQSQHVREPLEFVTVDPEDDFSLLQATIDLGQWFAFDPVLPTDKFVFIDYGRKKQRRSNRRILSFRSFGSGFCNTFYFQRRAGGWMLTKYENVGN